MAKDHVTLDISHELDKETIEKIFGKPPPVPGKKNVTITNNIPLMDAERGLDNYFNNNNLDASDGERSSQPLLEPTRSQQLPPLAGPEIDDLDGDVPKDASPYPGIDDGLLDTTDNKPEDLDHDHDGSDHHTELEPGDKQSGPDDDDATTDGKLPWEHDEPDHPYGDWNTPNFNINGISTRIGDSRPVSPAPGTIPDVNTYQQKKNLAQGMMDLALLSANANQLRYVLESSTDHSYYYPSLILISLSIIFQVAVGVGLIMNSRYDVNNHQERCKADKINNMTVLGVFLITIVNVFITSFSINTPVITRTVTALPPSAGVIQTA